MRPVRRRATSPVGPAPLHTPSLRRRVTATVLLLPMGVAVFWKALASGAASTSTALLGLLIGALLMAYPVVMLHLRSKPYFRQT